MAFCIECGTKLADEDKFCLECGASQVEDSAPKKEEPKKESKPKPKKEPKPEPTKEDKPAPIPKLDQKSAEDKPSKEDKPKKKKKKGKFKLIVVLIILASLVGGGAYAAYDWWQNSKSDESFTDYWMRQAGIDTILEDWLGLEPKEDEDDDKDDDGDEDDQDDEDEDGDEDNNDDEDDETGDKKYWYDEDGDIVDLDDEQYFLVDEDREVYYNPDDEEFYTPGYTEMEEDDVSYYSVYYNEDYSFMITFPRGWEDVMVEDEVWTDPNTGDTEYIYSFYVPTEEVDEEYQLYPGYVPMFGLTVMDEEYYDRLLEGDIDLSFPPEPIGTYDGYGYGFYLPNGDIPTDVRDRASEVMDTLDVDGGFSWHEVI